MIVEDGREFIVHEEPGVVYERQVKVLQALKNQYGDDVYYQHVRELCLKDLWFLLKFVLDYKFLDDKFHGVDVMRHLRSSLMGHHGKPADIMTLIPRAHCKTTMISGFIIQEILNNPDVAIAIVSGTEKLARFMSKLIADVLLHNETLQRCFSDILPSAKNLTTKWGLQGYFLPNRRPRVDPTLAFGSATANITGTHPDLLIFDDLVYSNKPRDLEISNNAFIEAMGLLPSHGRIIINGTRWHDGDLYGKILDGVYTGNLGPYLAFVRSCWNRETSKPGSGIMRPIYPKAYRNGMTVETGFSRDDLLRKKHNDPEFFNCQYLNDPAPETDAQMKASDVNVYETDEELPLYVKAGCIGVETTGPSITFPNVLRQTLSDFGINVYVQEITIARSGSKSVSKRDRILATCLPIFTGKKLWVKKWMMNDKIGLVEQAKRLRAAKHDDCIDAFHMIPAYMSCGIFPEDKHAANLYICCDLAFTTNTDSDYSCIMAVAVDSRCNYWVVDYKQMRESNLVTLANEVIKFFQKVNARGIDPSYNRSRKPTLGMSYVR